MSRRSGGEVIALEAARDPAADSTFSDPHDDAPTHVRDLLRMAWKRRWIIVGVLAFSLGAAVAWLAREPRIYRATSTIEISPTTPRYLGSGVQEVADTGPIAYWQTKEFFETQYQIIRSRAVASRVVENLGLDADADFLGLSRVTDATERQRLAERFDAATLLQRAIRVEPVKDSRIVRLSIEDRDPARARRIADALAEAYIEQNLERKLDTTRAASTWLSDQLGGLKTQVESSELRLHDFKRENDILTASFEDRQSISSQRLLALNDALTKVRIRLAEQEARIRTLRDARTRADSGQADALQAVQSVASHPTVNALKNRVRELEEKLVEVAGRYLENHPSRIALEEQLTGARTALSREIDRIVGAQENEHRELAETERQLGALIEGAKREAFELNRRAVDYNRLKREQENNQRLYDLVLQRLKEADLSALLRTNNAQVLDPAREPRIPVSPRARFVLFAAAIFGLLGGVALAFGLERLDDTMKSQDDVEKYVGLPFLGILPSVTEDGTKPRHRRGEPSPPSRDRDLHVHLRPKSQAAECVRAVRTNLLLTSPDRPFRRLLVTSAAPQEGKTTVAISVAIAMAQAGSRTLLVDTDMRRPRVHRSFGLGNDSGLTNVMAGVAKLSDVVRETEVPNLLVLPCGPLPPNPAELVHTASFRQLLQELDGRFDRVIFDSPPVAAVTDALILSGHTDGVLLVVKAGKTPREVARRTRRSLSDVNARIFGVVVNDLDLKSGASGHYYYYPKYGYAET